MRTQLKVTRDGDAFVARLAPSQLSAMYEALSYLAERDSADAGLPVLVGADRGAVDAVLERLIGPYKELRDVRLTTEELHMVHSALTAAPTMFLVRDGVFAEEPFHIRLGFYRETFDVLAHALAQAAVQA